MTIYWRTKTLICQKINCMLIRQSVYVQQVNRRFSFSFGAIVVRWFNIKSKEGQSEPYAKCSFIYFETRRMMDRFKQSTKSSKLFFNHTLIHVVIKIFCHELPPNRCDGEQSQSQFQSAKLKLMKIKRARNESAILETRCQEFNKIQINYKFVLYFRT